MMVNPEFISSIYAGWHAYQQLMINSLTSLNAAQLTWRPSQHHRSIEEIVRHIIAARARWFYRLMGEGGEEFEALARWDREGEKVRSSEELIGGILKSWDIMQLTIANWSATDWEQTWPGRGTTPKLITRPWVIWHLLEHDLHHGGEISLILGMNGAEGFDL